MIIAIAGGTGSGKSKVSARLKELGYRVIDADEVNRELLSEKEYLDKLKAAFPECFESGALNKRKLKELIFHDEGKRKTLNAIAHPEIMKRFIQKTHNSGEIVFAEIPLFIESGLSELKYDAVWAVVAGKERRIERVMARDGVSREFARRMVEAQEAEEKIAEMADYIIVNDADLQALHQKIDMALKELNGRQNNSTL
ncbi:MAG: dephospho-CoA kinase [Clostridiales bacterium]|jgi:dephospho-CoA kinase|nr:dephospho-CoA kinase [Clostridiales bacterium]HOK81389.1 dephospho-CoA kinase [Clostridia bacterium]HOL60689.1 dephospho-CoA kinase [Clostridia bacterium]HPO53264.1 dephospho-CoA kinase [Clostridia bacterium]